MTSELHEAIQDELDKHYNQIKYICNVQTDQHRIAKLGCFSLYQGYSEIPLTR